MSELECEVCESTDDLRTALLMTGSTDRAICGECYIAWYDGGPECNTAEGILRYRLKKLLKEEKSVTRTT